MKRGAVQKRNAHLVTVWVPKPEVAQLDQAVRLTDTDRSKVVRKAIREHLLKIGVPVEEEAA